MEIALLTEGAGKTAIPPPASSAVFPWIVLLLIVTVAVFPPSLEKNIPPPSALGASGLASVLLTMLHPVMLMVPVPLAASGACRNWRGLSWGAGFLGGHGRRLVVGEETDEPHFAWGRRGLGGPAVVPTHGGHYPLAVLRA